MNVEIAPKAYKDLKQINRIEAVKILEILPSFSDFPNVANIKKLTNFKPSYRCRIGDYRVLFEVENEILIIYRILHRKDSYK